MQLPPRSTPPKRRSTKPSTPGARPRHRASADQVGNVSGPRAKATRSRQTSTTASAALSSLAKATNLAHAQAADLADPQAQAEQIGPPCKQCGRPTPMPHPLQILSRSGELMLCWHFCSEACKRRAIAQVTHPPD